MKKGLGSWQIQVWNSVQTEYQCGHKLDKAVSLILPGHAARMHDASLSRFEFV